MPALPALSAILITPDSFESIRKVVRHLTKQEVCNQIELILVAPSRERLNLNPDDVTAFHSFQVVEVGVLDATPKGRAAGVRAAKAPVVVFVEDHVFPCHGWATALIEAHRQPWAAVGPTLKNANPQTITSWVNFLIEYSEWFNIPTARPVSHLPGHNCSYKREVLLDYGDQLERFLDAESILHWDLHRRGFQLYLEPKAQILHLNFAVVGASLPLRFYGGRLFAAARTKTMSPLHRGLYFVLSPLIPLVRFLKICRFLKDSGNLNQFSIRVFPAMAMLLWVDGFGEMIGYGFGPGQANPILADLEFNRHRFM